LIILADGEGTRVPGEDDGVTNFALDALDANKKHTLGLQEAKQRVLEQIR